MGARVSDAHLKCAQEEPRASMLLSRFADGLIAVLLAPACAACDAPLSHPSQGPVCSVCWNAIGSFTPPLCRRCGDALPSWRLLSIEAATCPRCRRRPSAISSSRAIGAYDGSLRAILHAFKYAGCRSLARGLGARLRESASDVLAGADILVPVPLHRTRRRARGFNQARELAATLGVPVVDALRRIRATPSQTDLPSAARHANVRNAFTLRRGWRDRPIRGLRVVLVDDVCTTGATIEACARVLRAAGAADVSAVTAARVVTRPTG
jgi:ComF family protein